MFFEIVGGILQMFLYGIDAVNPVGILYGILTMHCHIGADWFLPTLFLAEVIFFTIVKKAGQKTAFFMMAISFMAAFVVQEWIYGVAVVRRILVAFGFIVFQIGQESLIIMGTHQHIMLVANMLYGSVYSIQVQMILLLSVAIYEYTVLTAHRIFYKLI